MRIGAKLMLVALLPTLFVGSVAIVSTSRVQGELERVLASATVRHSREIMKNLEQVIASGIGTSRSYLHGMLVQNELARSNETLATVAGFDVEELVHGSIREAPQLFIAMENLYSGSKLSANLQSDIARFDDMLENLQFEQVLITNRYGLLVAATKTEGTATSFWQEPWWREAVRQGLYLGEPAAIEGGEFLRLPIAFRIDDPEGHLLGVARVLLLLDNAHCLGEAASEFDQ
ncbi:MAG TPA: hypothetical protein EYP14_00580, partial [Planctomycetaceae bacterium]|nr:hypothetical protein [Planctomycetaceae bacterium]